MGKIIKDYKITGKINSYDVINKEDTSSIIMDIDNMCAILVEDTDTIKNLPLTKDINKEYEIVGILKDNDKDFNKYLLDVFGKKLIDKYVTDKVLIIRRFNIKNIQGVNND